MALSEEQVNQIKEQIFQQIENMPPEQQEQIKEKIELMNNEELEQFLIQQGMIQNPEIPQSNQTNTKKCFLCSLSNGEIKSIELFENQNLKAVLDINPASKGHTLIIPKNHVQFLSELSDDAYYNLFETIGMIKERIKSELKPNGIKTILDETNHLTIHIIPVYDKEVIGISNKKTDEKEIKEIQEKIKPSQKPKITSKIDSELYKTSYRIP